MVFSETTESSLTRLERSGLLDWSEQECLRRIREALLWRFRRKDYGNTEWNAKGLLQHYGIPTEILDFSSSLEVAVTFATSKASSRGRICIVTKPIGLEAATIEYTTTILGGTRTSSKSIRESDQCNFKI